MFCIFLVCNSNNLGQILCLVLWGRSIASGTFVSFSFDSMELNELLSGLLIPVTLFNNDYGILFVNIYY
jgi:hypothetical protein